jgi:hypothetical protein
MPGSPAISDPVARQSIRRRRRIAWLCVAATIVTLPALVLSMPLGAIAWIRLRRLRTVRATLRDHSWRTVQLESAAPLFEVLERDRNRFGYGKWRTPLRFVGEVAGPTRPRPWGKTFSVVRETGSDQIHLVRGCVGNEISAERSYAIEDLGCPLLRECLPLVPCSLSVAGLESSNGPTEWLTVLVTERSVWHCRGERIGTLTRTDLDYSLLDTSNTMVVGRERRFWDDVFWCDSGDLAVCRGRVLELEHQVVHRTGWRRRTLRLDDGTLVGVSSVVARHRGQNEAAVIAVSTALSPLDRAVVLLQIAIARGLCTAATSA